MKYICWLIVAWVGWPSLAWIFGGEPFERGFVAGVSIFLSLLSTLMVWVTYKGDQS